MSRKARILSITIGEINYALSYLEKLINSSGGGGGGAVDSVNGKTGTVVLDKGDIGLPNTPNVDTTNATNITSGTLSDGRLSGNVPLLDASNSFTGENEFQVPLSGFGLKVVYPTVNRAVTIGWRSLAFPADDNSSIAFSGAGMIGVGGGKKLTINAGSLAAPGDVQINYGNLLLGNSLSVGTTSIPSASIHAISTTEQLRLGYDADNYITGTVQSDGSLNYNSSGTGSAFRFTFGGGSAKFFVSNTVTGTANTLRASTDNSQDFGTTAYRWRHGYFGTAIGIGITTTPSAMLDLTASTASLPHLNLIEGVDPSSPSEGNLWYNGTNLNFRTASSTVDLLAGGDVSGKADLVGDNAFEGNNTFEADSGNIVEFLNGGSAKALIDANGKLAFMDHTTNAGGIQFGNTSPTYLYRTGNNALALTGSLSVSGTVNGASSTELGHLSGVTSNIQTQLNSKQDSTAAIQTIVLTSNVSRALTSWGDITGLSFPVEINNTYWFKFYIVYTAGANTTGAKFGISGGLTGANPKYQTVNTSYDVGSTTWSEVKAYSVVTYDPTDGAMSSGSHLSPRNIATIEGTIGIGETTNIIARFASSAGGSNIIVQSYSSFVQYRKLT